MMVATTLHSSTLVLAGAVFLACAVEMVEALTIVLAVGHTRGWRSAFEGSAVALAALAVLVAVFGPALVHVPLNVLRLIVGGVLLIFGMQWLRKAILRSAGLKAKHDEDAAYAEAVAALNAVGEHENRDRIAFVMAFKGVFLEGLEVVVAVLTLGTSSHRLGFAAEVAVVALALVGAIGLGVSRQLSKVPENAMKTGVGVMLVSFGTFWVGEALHVRWPGADTSLLLLVAFYLLVVWTLVGIVRHATPRALKVIA